jgi:glucose-6-phosphate isomerase, archaeal
MNLPKTDYPISLELSFVNGQVMGGDVPQERRLSELGPLYYDQDAVAEIAKKEDRLIYDMVHNHFETSLSDLSMAVSRIQPGKIGDEYHMTKGHFHAQADQPEIYFCLHGTGFLLMETEDGEFRAEPWRAGMLTHIPAQWAHRVVNTGKDVLFFVSSFHKIAGHEYRLVEERGFAKVVVERNGETVLLPNPRRK